MSQRWSQPLLIAGLGLLFFAPLVLHPTEVLYSDHSDLLAEHLPAKQFLVHSLRETGELPLWCPYTFSGSPFVHDIQVGMFYPLHWPLYLLPEEAVGPGLSWLVVFHVILAGWCMLAYARSQGLHGWAALVAATGYMFAGRWLLHVLGGGFYVLIALAWLPLVLLLLEAAIERGSLLRATGAGAVFALIILNTHPQWTFYSGVFIALWSLGPALERAGFFDQDGSRNGRRTRDAFMRWIACGSWAALVAVALSAVQLLPTLEAAAYSSRAAGVESSEARGGGLQALLFLIGPTLVPKPFNLGWEDRGGLGLLWIFAAALAPLLGRGRVRFQAVVCLLLLLFAFGGSALVQSLPGFRLFRQPARMLLVAGLPVAFLAGSATQALFTPANQDPAIRRRCQRMLLRVVIGAVILCGGFALRRSLVEGEKLCFHVYWATLLATIPITFSLLRRSRAEFAWWLILLIDLWGVAWPLVAVRSETEIYASSSCLQRLEGLGLGHARVLDRDAEDGASSSPLGAGTPLALRNRLEAVRGYNPLDVLRYKEYLQFIAGQDASLRPFEGSLTFPAIGDIPIANRAPFDLLGIRYLLQPTGLPPEGIGWHRLETDSNPIAYDFIAGGPLLLGSYTLYENENAFPRAFFVPHAAPLPDRANLLAAFRETDFRCHVLLEDLTGEDVVPSYTDATQPPVATLAEYQPNRVVVEVVGTTPGYLVLTDVWYPGWICTVDGEPTTLYRANYLFRSVQVARGMHRVEFTFRPESYLRGRTISLWAVLSVICVYLFGMTFRFLRTRVGAKSGKKEML